MNKITKSPRTKNMFNRNDESWTEEALELAKEVQAALSPIFDKYYKEGYSSHELCAIMVDEVMVIGAGCRLSFRK